MQVFRFTSQCDESERVYDSTGTHNTDNLGTLSMVFILVGVVKGVFICFAVVAVCYRYWMSYRSHRERTRVPEMRSVLYIGFNST